MKNKRFSLSNNNLFRISAAAIALGVLPLLLAGYNQQAVAQPAATNANGDYLPAASIVEIMDSMVMSSADVLWSSTGSISTKDGIIDLSPQTDEDWQKLRWAAVTLAEATNAMLIPGRHIVQPGTPLGDPSEGLTTDQVQALLDGNRPAWVGFSHALHKVAMDTITAVDNQDVDALSEAGGTMDEVCEACHLVFWYPPQN